MKTALKVLVYFLLTLLILALGFLPVMYLAGPHSEVLPRGLSGPVWFGYLATAILAPWPILRWAARRREQTRL